MLFTCSYHYSLYNSRYPAHDVFGYLFGCLIFVLAYRFSGTSGWLERHLFRDGEGVLLPGGHCGEQSIRGVKNAVGIGSPAHQRAGFLTKDSGGDRQYN